MDSTPDSSPSDPRDNSRSVDELISVALGEPDEDNAWDAIFTLRERGSREVFERASVFCRSFCPVERKLGAAILGQLGLPERTFPEECLNLLLAMMDTEQDESVLGSILVALSHLRDRRAIERAASFREHPNSEVRFGVVYAMTGHEDSFAVKVLIGLTRDTEADVRDWACFGLGSQIEFDSPELRDALGACPSIRL